MIGTIILYWVAIGFTIWLFRTFVYFHGIGNYVNWVIEIMEKIHKNKKAGKLIRDTQGTFIIYDFWAYIICGPFVLLDVWRLHNKIKFIMSCVDKAESK
jgi:hypothetical protein